MDSLVDIVSNNVGILIILAAFMAMIALLNPMQPDEADTQAPPRETPPPRLQVPWSHATNKSQLYFAMRENRIHFLDMRPFYEELAERSPTSEPEPVTMEHRGLKVRFFPVTNQVYCLEFTPSAGHGENWVEASRPGAEWQQVLQRYPPEQFVYFFWVGGDSFGLFREVRQSLWDGQYEVGWKPILPDAPLEVCNGFEGSTAFQPQ